MGLILRDPFARTEVHSRKVTVEPNRTCDWCGHARSSQKTLLQFRTESDDGRVSYHRGLFCSKTCHDAYHD